MSWIIRNKTVADISIPDLGITIAASSDNSLLDQAPDQLAKSADLIAFIQATDIVVLDPIDDVTELSAAASEAAVRAANDPHYGIRGGVLNQIDDVTLTAPAVDETLRFDGSNWVNSPGGNGFSGFGIWRYRTAITSNPSSGQLQFDNTTIDSATELYVNVTNDDGTDMSAFLSLVTSGSFIYLQIQNDSSQFVVLEVGTSSLSAGVFTFPITNVESQGTAPANNVRVAFVASGAGSGGGGGTDEKVKISANDTTAGFLNGKLVVTANETSLTEINDGGNETLEVGIADNPVLPGTGSTTFPIGTTAERTVSPVNGAFRYNTDLNVFEGYVNGSWVSFGGNGTGPGTLAGSLHGYHFLSDKYGYGKWLGSTTKHIPSDETHYIMPYDCELVSLTYSADKTSDIDIFVETAADGAGSGNSTLFNWTVSDARVARISTLSGAGGPGGLLLPKGTKLALFTDEPASGNKVEPSDVIVSVYIQWSSEDQEEDVEAYGGDFS